MSQASEITETPAKPRRGRPPIYTPEEARERERQRVINYRQKKRAERVGPPPKRGRKKQPPPSTVQVNLDG